MQAEFFSAALGGPVTYSGMALAQAHSHMGITREDFSHFAGHLFDTLADRGCDRDLVHAVVERVSLYVDDIVGGYGEDG
jgi:hemoglobin